MDVQTLEEMSSDDLNDLFLRCKAGDLPHGKMDGTVLTPNTSRSVARIIKRIVWQGKTFDAAARTLTNRINGLDIIEADVYKTKSWFDGEECIVLDYTEPKFAGRLRDELRQIQPGFYLGKAFAWKRAILHFTLEQA